MVIRLKGSRPGDLAAGIAAVQLGETVTLIFETAQTAAQTIGDRPLDPRRFIVTRIGNEVTIVARRD